MKLAIYLVCILVLLFAPLHGDEVTTRAARALDIPTVEQCALIANPALYDGKEIRLHGVYSVCGTNDSHFFSSSCRDKTLWVEFNPTYQSCSQSKAVKSLTDMTRKSGTRMKPHSNVLMLDYRAADVEFIGQFTAANPYKQAEPPPTNDLFAPIRPNRENYDFIFRVACVERVKPLPKNAKY
jgi:hypothetical protein